MDAEKVNKSPTDDGEVADDRNVAGECRGDDNNSVDNSSNFVVISPRKTQPRRKQAPSPQKQELTITEDMEKTFNEGYDLDEFVGPYWGVTRSKGDQLFDDDDIDNLIMEVLLDDSPPNVTSPPTVSSIKCV